MIPRERQIVLDLERYRSECCDGTIDLAEALRRLAELRLSLLRSRRRSVALVLSQGVSGGKQRAAAVDAALAMLRAETGMVIQS
jgi:hypothetical protein